MSDLEVLLNFILYTLVVMIVTTLLLEDFGLTLNKRYKIYIRGGFVFKVDKKTAFAIHSRLTRTYLGKLDYFNSLDVTIYYDDVIKITKGKETIWERVSITPSQIGTAFKKMAESMNAINKEK